MVPLNNDDLFPNLHVPAVGGGVLSLPTDLAGAFGVVLIYRGHWCPFCNDQMAAFAKAVDLVEIGIRTVAFSVDDEETTKKFIAKHGIPFQMGHSVDVDAVVRATGAYTNVNSTGKFLETTGFVLSPEGKVISAVYSSRAIGRLVPSDVSRLVSFIKAEKR